MYKLFLQRKVGKRTNDQKIEEQIDYILKRAFDAGRGRTWSVDKRRIPPVQKDGFWHFTYELNFQKGGGQQGSSAEYNQWENIKAMIIQSGQAARYTATNSPWLVIDPQNNANSASVQAVNQIEDLASASPESIADIVAQAGEAIADKLLNGVREVGSNTGAALTWKDLSIPPEFLGAESDDALSQQ